MKRFLIFIKAYWVMITSILLGVITVLSLWPLDALPPVPGGDKTHHFLAYAVLAMPAGLRKPRRWIVLCLCFIGYSGIIELVQPFVNRYCDWRDLLANGSGVVCGAFFGVFLNFLFSVAERRAH